MKRTALLVALGAAVILGVGSSAIGAPSSNGISFQSSDELKVDLNRAGVDELVELPGIGEKVAARIVEYREKNGPFESPEEIMNVRGIGEKTFLKLEPHLTVSSGSERDGR